MKFKKATYLSILLLSSFLLSVSLNIAFGFYSNPLDGSLSMKHQTVSSSDNGLNISSSFNNAKATESENESDFEDAFTIQEFIIPFIFSFAQIEEIQPLTVANTEVSLAEANPIYISVHNFRI
ncbi:MAG: hypothetical protein JST26_01415 [Bacteroidetes bacterium]|nr:hypothetical protein [Bacteroidota bacterium]